MLPWTQSGGASILKSFIFGCTVRPLQSAEGKWVAWAGCCEPLFVMPWALRGISAGAMMSTEIVGDVDDEAKSPSRMSSIMLIGRMYFSLYMSQKRWVTSLRVEVSVDPGTCYADS